MKEWLRSLWNDVKGNFKYDVAKAVALAVFTSTGLASVQKLRQLPADWVLLLSTFCFSLIALLLISVFANRRRSSGEGFVFTVNARHLLPEQATRVQETLRNHSTSDVAIVTLRGDAERAHYANSLANTFRRCGWHVMQKTLDAYKDDAKGLILIRHSGKDAPDLAPIKSALAVAEVFHREAHVGEPRISPLYKRWGGVSTRVPVIFVGSDERNKLGPIAG